LNLWLEYEDGTSVEADLARQLDKFEMIVQANEYEMAQSKVLQSFFDSTQDVHPSRGYIFSEHHPNAAEYIFNNSQLTLFIVR